MNKKFKMAILFALSCGVAAGCNTTNEHTHSYTQWAHDDNQHWKVCPDDNAVDESSKEDHLFVAGECECGATERTVGPVTEEKYGTVTGKVKLYKQGAYVTDLTGIKVDMGNDDVEIEGSVADGAYQFTVTNVKVGETYNLTIAKTGYQSYSTEIELEEEGEEAKIGGSNGVTLQYEVFGLLIGWDGEYHDFSHVNDENPYVAYLENDGSKTFDVLTKDSYNNVSASLKVQYNNSVNSMHTQGIVLKFEDGKHVIVRYHNGDQKNGNIQYVNEAWNVCPKEKTLFGEDAGLNKWGEAPIHTLFDEETAAIKADGLDLNVVLKDGTLYTFFDGKFIGKYALPAEYAAKKVQVGYFAWNPGNNVQFKYAISADVPATMSTTLGINVTQPQGVTGCAVTATPQKDSYDFGEQIELTFTAADGYKLEALTVGGEDRLDAVANGKLTVTADRPNLEIAAEFTQIVTGSVNAQISGSKFGIAGNSLTDGTEVTLSCAGLDDVTAKLKTVDGKITLAAQELSAGVWTVHIAGYQPQKITVEKNAVYTEAIVLQPVEEFSLIQGWGMVSSAIADDGSANLTITNEMETAVSNTAYGDIAITVNLSGTNMTKDGNTGTQGIVLRFSDNKLAVLRMEGRTKIQFACATEWFQGSSADGSGWQDLLFFTENDKYLTAFDKGELKLTAVRKGATIYAILTVDGVSEIIGCRTFDEKYLNDGAKVGMYCEGTVNDSAKSWKFAIGDADASLAAATSAVGADKISYLGDWTDGNGTLAVAGKGYVEFKADEGTVRESVTIKLAAANAKSEQGIVYRFADGKYVAIRYQKTDDGAKVQFTMDTVLMTNASLIGWIDYAMTEDEIASFDGAGIDLTLVRDGNKFYVVLGGRALGTQTVDATKYASANGNMGVMIWEGNNAAFAYEHKTGEDVTIPAEN